MKEFNPCDICVEKKCPTNGKCSCETCNNKDKCQKYRGLSATIRITTKCTQKCNHCCFSCSPDSKDMMTIKTAKNISLFIKNNGISNINLMGGEIFCNPNYKNILSELIPAASDRVRLVTNSDWVEQDKSFIEFISKFKNIYLALSRDKFHTNKHVNEAEKILKEKNIPYVISDKDIVNDNSVVPIGRASFGYGFYSSMGCYCHNPEHFYNFLIDELGEIYKCGMGVWNYANINDYINGGFRERFKYFNKVFYKTFILNCASCIRAYNSPR
jgi:hypothetical protein